VQVLLITGAASGIGLAAARRMSRRMHVIVADLDEDRAAEAARSLKAEGRMASAVQVDVTQRSSVQQMMARIGREIGPVHALFNNAGISRPGPAADMAESVWDLMIDVHVKGTFLCCQAVLPQMCERREGVIVNMSSDYAVVGMMNGAAYAAAKSAIFSLTKSLAAEFAPYAIRVNALGPGPIDTPLLRAGRTGDDWKAARAALLPIGRLGQPDEVAAVLDFLLSEHASYMTGQIVHPNGGQVMW
jgi:NAD(P)-dependent dehydrogenase (short-subunit alcohol dehydrogenase family)